MLTASINCTSSEIRNRLFEIHLLGYIYWYNHTHQNYNIVFIKQAWKATERLMYSSRCYKVLLLSLGDKTPLRRIPGKSRSPETGCYDCIAPKSHRNLGIAVSDVACHDTCHGLSHRKVWCSFTILHYLHSVRQLFKHVE